MVGIRSKLVVIGNSMGVRLPKSLLEQSQITGEVELIARPFCVIIRAIQRPRAGWDDQLVTETQISHQTGLDSATGAETEPLWRW